MATNRAGNDGTELRPEPPPHYLREWRLKLGLSLGEVAARLGTSKGVVSRYETFHRKLTLDLQFRIAEALGLWPTDLFLPPDMTSIDSILRNASKEDRDAIAAVARQMVSSRS